MKPTIHESTCLADVSKATGSRVFNNSNKNPTTREHTHDGIGEHGLVSEHMAMQLARGEKRPIGVVLPELTWSFMAEILQGVTSVVDESEHEMLCYSATPCKNFRRVVEHVQATNKKAGVLASIFTQSPQPLISLYRSGLPLVLINLPAARLSVPWVSAADRAGGMLATRYLLHLGHERIAFLFPSPDLPCFHDRYEGYCLALREAGLEPDPALALYDDGSFSRCLREIQAMSEPPTAVFAANDHLAYNILALVETFGWRVPDDLAVVGFDDMEPPFPTRPALTTVRQPFHEIGQCAAEMLLSIIDPHFVPSRKWWEFSGPAFLDQETRTHEEHVWPSMHIQLPVSLSIRQSCSTAHHDSRSTR